MKIILGWLHSHKFEIHSIAFLLIVIPPLPLYLVAKAGHTGWIIPLLLPVIIGNMLVLAVK